jgi:hypothetical protein
LAAEFEVGAPQFKGKVAVGASFFGFWQPGLPSKSLIQLVSVTGKPGKPTKPRKPERKPVFQPFFKLRFLLFCSSKPFKFPT